MQQRTQNEEIDLEPGDFDDRDTMPAPEEDDIDDVDDDDSSTSPMTDDDDEE